MPRRHLISQQAYTDENAKLIASLNEAYKDVDGTSNLTNGANCTWSIGQWLPASYYVMMETPQTFLLLQLRFSPLPKIPMRRSCIKKVKVHAKIS
jgi:hypothetical protein